MRARQLQLPLLKLDREFSTRVVYVHVHVSRHGCQCRLRTLNEGMNASRRSARSLRISNCVMHVRAPSFRDDFLPKVEKFGILQAENAERGDQRN